MSQYDKGYYDAMASRNFQDLLNAASDASMAMVNNRNRERVVSEADYLYLRQAFDDVVKQRDAITNQRNQWMAVAAMRLDILRAFKGRVLDADKANAMIDRLCKERDIPHRIA